MLDYIWNLLPAWAKRLIEPEVDDLVAGFHKLEDKLAKIHDRHVNTYTILHAVRAEIESEIDDTAAEIERAKRIAGRIRALVD